MNEGDEMDLNIKARNIGESTRVYVYNILSDNIINLNLKPGCSISEKEIADLLNVSRTPVREAFIQLSQEDLIETYPQKGTYVSLIDLDLVEESRFMRETLESAVAKLAAKEFPQALLFDLESNLNMQSFCIKEKNYTQMMKYDDEFHETLFKGTNKSRVWESIQRIGAQFRRFRTLNLVSTSIDTWETTYQDHTLILKAIKGKNGDEAAEMMKTHLTRAVFDKIMLQEKCPDYFKR
ncbi:GntR family transcriptional regulator [Marinisporobacter balticus]|uniref:GntR family transcriptional regulator n=1 Tax=Marinisporobacter balticus TaxID=2018667 RepID=A0A4R2KRJ5_9FIRM|nr:GntR family transcriptional regulator [Marinisporobacter balticus]TCO76911.1 GntR family transcriptional regulator [Marinisporobacter balticus]